MMTSKYLHFSFLTMTLCLSFHFLNAQTTILPDKACINCETNDGSAVLDIQADDKGILIPRLTTAQRTGISSPANGLLVFDTTTESFWFYSGSWSELGAGGGASDNLGDHSATQNLQLNDFYLSNDGDDEGLKISNDGNIGIGRNITITHPFQVGQLLNQDVLDQSSTTNSGGSYSIDASNSAAQTFTSQLTGRLRIVQLYIGGSGLFKLEILEGSDPNSSIVLGSYTRSIGSTVSNYPFYPSPYPVLTMGQVYTLRLTRLSGSGNWYHDDSNPYNGGQAYANSGSWIAQPTHDLRFRTYVQQMTLPKIDLALQADGKLLINDYTLPNADGYSNQFLKTDGSGSTSWADNNILQDVDSDTKIQTEESYDEDLIRFDIGGTERWVMKETRLEPQNTGSSVFIGKDAGGKDDLSDNYNVAVGNSALFSNITGYRNTSVGRQSQYSGTSNGNTSLGYVALYSNVSGQNNTAIGAYSSNNINGFDNIISLGYSTACTASNQARIGNSSVGSIGGYASWTTLPSDERFKQNVREDVKGLEFINALRPVTYTVDQKAIEYFFEKNYNEQDSSVWNNKYKASNIKHTGFIAQEVEQAAQSVGYDFSGVDKPKNEKDFYGLRYAEFTVPLVKAVQEMSATDEELKMENKKLKEQLDVVEENYNNVIAKLKRMESMIEQLQGCCVQKEEVKENSIKIELANAQKADVPYLEQNAPNPFFEQTIIRYYLPEKFITAEIRFSDLSGKIIKTVQLRDNGIGTISISAKELAAGTYAYTLIVDDKIVDTKKMILTR